MRVVLKIPFHKSCLWTKAKAMENVEFLERLERLLKAKSENEVRTEAEFYDRRLREVEERLEESEREVETLSKLLEEFEEDRSAILERLKRYSSLVLEEENR